MRRKVINKSIIFMLLCLFSVFIVVPLLWMFSTSMRKPVESFKLPPAIFPERINFDQYRIVFKKVDFFMFIRNSFKIAFISVLLHVVFSSMSAFAFARLDFPFKKALFILFLSAIMIPGQVMNIPRFLMMVQLKLVDTHLALILPAFFDAMGIFLIRQFMMTIPKSYDEAAYIDGANKFHCFLRIVMPMTKPAIMVIAVRNFIGSWNDFYTPLIYLNTTKKMTLPLGLAQLRNALGGDDNQAVVLAGVVLSLIAPLLFYIVGQRYLVEGINLGGIK